MLEHERIVLGVAKKDVRTMHNKTENIRTSI